MKKIYPLFLFLMVAILHPKSTLGVEGQRITGKISLGYDNTVLEQSGSKICRPFINLYLDAQFPLSGFKRLEGTFRLQNGFKIIREEEDIALNQVDLRLSLPILPKITSEIIHELKQKTVPLSSDQPVQNEYGYLYWHSGLSLKYNGRHFNSSIRYLLRNQDYQDKDFFDSRNQQTQFITKASLSHKLNVSLSGKVERIRLSREGGNDQEVIEGPEQPKGRIDTLYELSMGFQWLAGILINPAFALQKNRSQRIEYTYSARQWSILAALPFWGETTLQCYGHLQLRDYDSEPPPPSYPIDEDDTEQLYKLLILSLSREVLTHCSLEVRYMLSQSDPSMSSYGFKKQSYSLGAYYTF